jgi:hypothetical protein
MKQGSENLKNIDKLVKARADVPTLTYNKTLAIGGLTSDLDIPPKGYVDSQDDKLSTKHEEDVKKLNKKIDDVDKKPMPRWCGYPMLVSIS